MVTNLKAHLYRRGTNKALDDAFDSGISYGALKLGSGVIFWKTAFRWYAVELSQTARIYRRVEHVYGKLCCGGSNYDIQSLVLVLKDGSELELLVGKNEIGDAVKKQAENLLQVLQAGYPEISFGKP